MRIPTRQIRPALALGAAAIAITTTAAGAQARTPIRDCGDTAASATALTVQGVTCKSARAVASIVPGKTACSPAKGGCSVRGFTCLTGQAGKELFLIRCENSTQTHFIRFEYGS